MASLLNRKPCLADLGVSNLLLQSWKAGGGEMMGVTGGGVRGSSLLRSSEQGECSLDLLNGSGRYPGL
jgi:hypothetical protein